MTTSKNTFSKSMDINQIQKPIKGLFLVIFLLISCQSRNDCGLKCGINMSYKEEEVCILFDTSLLKKPYVRYIPLPEINRINNDIRITALEIRTENWSENFHMRIGYDQTYDTNDVNLKLWHMKTFYDYSKNTAPVISKYNEIAYNYFLFDTLNGGYIQYDFKYYLNPFNDRVGWVDVYYVRKEADNRILSVGMKLSDNMFRSGDSLLTIELINSIEVLKAGCDKKCLCYPD